MNKKEEDKINMNDFIDVQLNYLRVALIVRDTSLMIFLIVKVFLFDFEDAGRMNIMTEKDEVTEEQGIKDHESKLEEKLSFNAEKAWPDTNFWDIKNKCLQLKYEEKSQHITKFLLMLRQPEELSVKEFYKFKDTALCFLIQDGHLFHQLSKNMSLRWIINEEKDCRTILYILHED